MASRAARSGYALFGAVAALAVVLRILPLVVRPIGLHFFNGYDDSVYYAAADALTFGHVPYRDYVLLHPPGITLLLTPFAALGRLTTDGTGMAVARLAFIGLGALNAALVAGIAARWSRRAGWIAGVLYACWYPAVVSEQTPRLETVGTAVTLGALLLLLRAAPRARHDLLAGALLGFGVCVKIWGVVPLLVVVGWQVAKRRWPSVWRLAAGSTATMAAVLVPFFALAPHRMFDLVVRDQFRRSAAHASPSVRVSSIFGIGDGRTSHHVVVAWLVVALLVLAIAGCLLEASTRPLLVLLAAQLVVLLASPSYYRHYAEFVAPLIVLALAIGATRPTRMGLAPLAAIAAVAGTGLVAALAIAEHVRPLPGAVSAAVPTGCLMSDDPGVLVQTNRLSEQLRRGCPVAVDLWGVQQDVGRADYQHYVVQYLTSGDAFVLARRHDDALTPQSLATLDGYPLLATADGIDLRRGHLRR